MESFLVVLSETTLALYPILIKLVPTELTTQVFLRFLTFSILAFTMGTWADFTGTWGSLSSALRSTLLGGLTLAHVGTSYYAFQELSAGSSMTLFYTYPFWIVLGSFLFFGEKVGIFEVGLLITAFIGTLLVAYGSKEEGLNETKGDLNWKGVLAGLASALTEAAMYFAVRTSAVKNPFFSTLELYPGALLLLLPILFFMKMPIDTRPGVWGQLFSFNALVGFFGYALRFYTIPRISSVLFSLLSFIGVVASFTWGLLFVGEKPNIATGVGAALVTLAAGALGVRA